MSTEIKADKDVKQEFRKSLIEYKNTSESYVALSIYKNTDLYFDANLSVDDFHDPIWKFYFAIAEKLIKQGKKALDDIVVGLLVGDNEQLQSMYDQCGGYKTISNGVTFVQEENFDSYLTDVKKYNALLGLHDLGFPIMEKFEAYKSMDADKIQVALEGAINAVFADIEIDEPVEDLSEGLWNVVMEAHRGEMRGFPYYSGLLTEWTNGMALSNLTVLSANSGMGKTFLTIAQILPNMIEFDEKLLIICNEEDRKKWQRELITWAVNNKIGGNFNKQRFLQGDFSGDEMKLLKEGTGWLEEKMEEGIITFINLQSFTMDRAIKTIKKQSAINGIDYFVLDTLKLDSDIINQNVQSWLSLQQNMVSLYDLIKASNANKHVFVTYQLGKSAMMSRFLDQNSLGVSKNITDVVSSLLLMRHALESEKEDGRNEVMVNTKEGMKKMSKDKEYFILFLGKNRAGPTNRQLVYEVDMGRNIMTDFGTCIIPEDI